VADGPVGSQSPSRCSTMSFYDLLTYVKSETQTTHVVTGFYSLKSFKYSLLIFNRNAHALVFHFECGPIASASE
jgi:hypothetical protein